MEFRTRALFLLKIGLSNKFERSLLEELLRDQLSKGHNHEEDQAPAQGENCNHAQRPCSPAMIASSVHTSSKACSQSPERLWHGTRGKRSRMVEPSSFCPDFISALLPCFFFLDHQTPIRRVINMCSFTCHALTVTTAAKRVVA